MTDVKPRLTKEQHDILEKHFQQQHKPSTNTKRGFADALGVPLDKINNWFQNRRAKVKQDFKKQVNQYNMSLGLYGQPPVPMMPPQYPPHGDPHQAHLSIPHEYYTVSADLSPASVPVQSVEGPSALDLGPQMALQQQAYDMHHSLRSIPEADRATAYHPNAVMHSFMAATAGAPYMQHNAATLPPQDNGFSYDTSNLIDGLPNYSMPSTMDQNSAPSHAPFQFDDFGIDFTSLTANPPQGDGGGSISDEASPFSGAQSSATTQSSNVPNAPSVASITSMYSGWTDEQKAGQEAKSNNDSDDVFDSPYNLPQASVSDAALFAWNQNGHHHNPSFSHSDFYAHSNTSAQAGLSSPGQHERTVSAGPSEFEAPIFGDDGLPRRNSSTSNLASNIEAINIQNRTPDQFDQADQTSSIATRRQKRPTALNSSTLRSASYTSGMPSPGNNGDQTLRRIRSSGIASASGRVQKPTAGPSQRSPMSLTFTEAASSPKFARTFSASSTTTVSGAQGGGSLAPPTPQTPNETPRFPYWQSNTVLRNHPTMPDHSSPESLNATWPMDPPSAGNYSSGTSPPSTPLDLAQLNQARLGQESLYRDTPPQSAPATQQGFPRTTMMQPPQMRAGFHSSTDLTIAQPKPSHFRRPSLPEPRQEQTDNSNQMYAGQFGNLSYDDFRDVSLTGITHNVPFAPPVSAMPDFLVHHYAPPLGPGPNGTYMRRPNEPQAKNFIFANQGPSDFRS
ncbi:hypothetical protein DM02DRAFT_523806 [Periconia macrospinosa]|uniref:Homeobox domain-containing protein n=1 Tax=Periconia macrospinosa TaxID=97972 RepID=A0A2V1DV24_9PLEO|nr:hypothetical protein DM02DRAFT_523806 [Periconia macrospinosa]